MKKFFIITLWEFFRHFKSRSFLLATFVSPVLLALIILVPTLFLDNPTSEQPRIIGCMEFDSSNVCPEIQKRFIELKENTQNKSVLQLVPIKPDTSLFLQRRFLKVASLKTELDSLNDSYNQIKERRKYIFQKPKTRSREQLLKQTYEELIRTRESRDLTQLEYEKTKTESDSIWRREMIYKADNMLRDNLLEGYLLIDPQEFYGGVVEFHSLLPSNFLQIEAVRQAVQVVIVEARMKQDNIRVDKIQEWLSPVQLREIQLHGEDKQEFDFMITYLGPIIVVLFLFISIFTSSGFLFSGVLQEKTNRVIEVLLSSVNHYQLIAGKIFGLGILGIFQIFIWFLFTGVLIVFNVLKPSEIGFLTLRNAGLFVTYFILGYLFFASIFVGIGSLFSNEEDAHNLNQFMRMLSIFPIVLAVLVLETPNSLLVRILSFIPPLTPTFMILRTPLGNPPAIDFYISIGIMVVSIIISVFFAGKLFKVGSLLYGKKPSLREIFSLMFSR
ncbi:MAG: ABC transporter permease [Calditrichia bacterium]